MAISVTGIFCAFLRGFHSEYENPKIFDDPFGLRIIPDERIKLIKEGFVSTVTQAASGMPENEINSLILKIIQNMPAASQVLSRSSYAEERLEDFIDLGGPQYLIIGSGLDTFALRRVKERSLKIFEIDKPEMLAFKKEQVVRIQDRLPRNVEYIAADLSKDDLISALESSSFDRKEKAFVSMLGLIMYLTEDEISGLFKTLERLCSAGSVIAFDYFDEESRGEEKSSPRFRQMLEQGKFTGERFKSLLSEDEIGSLVKRYGFTLREHLSPEKIDELYFLNRGDDYRACEHVHFAAIEKLENK